MLWTVLLGLSAQAQEIYVDGDCDETFTIGVTGLTPDRRYALVSSASEGISVLTEGACAGATLGLDRETLALRRLRTVDETGTDIVTVPGREAICGMYTQAINLATCGVSDVKRLGHQHMMVAEGRGGSYGSALHSIDLETRETSFVADLDVPVTGLSRDSEGNLWYVQSMGWGTPDVGVLNEGTGAQTWLFESEHDGPHSGFSWMGERLFFWTENGDNLHEMDPLTGEDLGTYYGADSYDNAMCGDARGNLYRSDGNTIWLLEDDGSGEEVLCTIPDWPGTSGNDCTIHDGEFYMLSGDSEERTLWHVDLSVCDATDTGIVLPDGADALAGTP
jgi:hypothetical protein